MNSLLFQQLFEAESSTYSYLLADEQTREAILIDPVLETVKRDLQLIQDLNLKLLFTLETHVHADHITGAYQIAQATGAQIAISARSQAVGVDRFLKDGEKIKFGKQTITVLETPGHTNDCVCFLMEDRVFTGDTLLIRGNGRTDFQHGSAEKLYHSITTKLFTLPDSILVYPGHDYKGMTSSTIGDEKRLNPRLSNQKTLQEFIHIMNGLNLAPPKKIDIAVPANLNCGKV